VLNDRLFRIWGRGCVRGAVLQVGISLIVLGSIFAIGVLSANLPVERETSYIIFFGLLIAFILVFVSSFIIWIVITVSRRTRLLDAAFKTLGLTGKMYLLGGSQYQGSYRGRKLDVYFYHGQTLDIRLSTPLERRASISHKTWLGDVVADLASQEPMDVSETPFEPFKIQALDKGWMQNLLSDPQAQSAVLHLMENETNFELRQILIQSQAFIFRLRHISLGHISGSSVRFWLDDLHNLASIVESY